MDCTVARMLNLSLKLIYWLLWNLMTFVCRLPLKVHEEHPITAMHEKPFLVIYLMGVGVDPTAACDRWCLQCSV